MKKKLKNEVKKNYHQAVQTGKPLSFQLNTVRLGREINEYHYFRVALCYKNALCELSVFLLHLMQEKMNVEHKITVTLVEANFLHLTRNQRPGILIQNPNENIKHTNLLVNSVKSTH